jgi:hypothetical protein
MGAMPVVGLSLDGQPAGINQSGQTEEARLLRRWRLTLRASL